MRASDRPYATIVILATLSAVLAILLVHQLQTGRAVVRQNDSLSGTGMRDDERSAAQVQAMVTALSSGALWDNHPDADVGRVMQPRIDDMVVAGRVIHSNLQGMREREVVMPKPEGTLRVVLLGDSFVYGLGVEADQRMGVHLERFLEERRGEGEGDHEPADIRQIEVLHFGLSSWSLVSECAFLRRQLALLLPDLVLHLSVRNDLADTLSARGFGSMGTFSARRPDSADGAVRSGFARWSLDKRGYSTLPLGVDHESRVRFSESATEIARLAQTVTALGGQYLHVFHWGTLNPVAAQRLTRGLTFLQALYLPSVFAANPAWRQSDVDEHWNPVGHEQVARLLFSVIRERGLLPTLALDAWPEVDDWAEQMVARGRATALAPDGLPEVEGRSAFTIGELTPTTASQAHAGVAADGTLSPYASIMLRSRKARTLTIKGACLDRPELNGKTITVSLDEVPVGKIRLSAGRSVERTVKVPWAVNGRPWLTVRFVADDYVYEGDDLRRCVSFRLESIELE